MKKLLLFFAIAIVLTVQAGCVSQDTVQPKTSEQVNQYWPFQGGHFCLFCGFPRNSYNANPYCQFHTKHMDGRYYHPR